MKRRPRLFWIFWVVLCILCADGHSSPRSSRLRGHHVGTTVIRWRNHPISNPYCIKMYRPRKTNVVPTMGRRELRDTTVQRRRQATTRRRRRELDTVNGQRSRRMRRHLKAKSRSKGEEYAQEHPYHYPNGLSSKGKQPNGYHGGDPVLHAKGKSKSRIRSKGRGRLKGGPLITLPQRPPYQQQEAVEVEWYYDHPRCYDHHSSSSKSVSLDEATSTPTDMFTDTTAPREDTTEIIFRDGFPCNMPSFKLNSFPEDHPYPQLIPNEQGDPNLCFLRMTAEDNSAMDGVMAATAMLDLTFDPSNVNRKFSMTIGYKIHGSQETIGNGMAFVLHQDPRGTSAIGPGGGGLSVYDDSGQGAGIRPALVVEWDTVDNAEFLDDSALSIHIMQVDAAGTFSELAEAINVPILTDSTGATSGRMWVDYCDDQVLRVYVNNAGDEKPFYSQAEAPFDMNTIFAGQDFVAGYAASTGWFTDYHDILSWDLSQRC